MRRFLFDVNHINVWLSYACNGKQHGDSKFRKFIKTDK